MAYTGPVELARPPPRPQETEENESVSSAMMALVLGNQKKKAQMRQMESDEAAAASSSAAVDTSVLGAPSGADDAEDMSVDDEVIDEDEEAEFDETHLANDPSARFILSNQKLRYRE
jgi:hypothetical protein